jgi:hypothetical protein
MSIAETVFVIVAVVLILLAIGNVVFSVLAERNNSPIGIFIECDGVRFPHSQPSSQGLCQGLRDAYPTL